MGITQPHTMRIVRQTWHKHDPRDLVRTYWAIAMLTKSVGFKILLYDLAPSSAANAASTEAITKQSHCLCPVESPARDVSD